MRDPINFFNPLGSVDTIWNHKMWSTLIQVMAWCLMAPRHYLNQWWHTVYNIHGNFTWSWWYDKFSVTKICFIFKITVTPLTDKWVKWTIEYFIWYVNCVLTQVNLVITSQVSKHNNHLIYSNHVSQRILPLPGGHSLTHCDLVMYISVRKLGHHWSSLSTGHYLN